MQNLSPKKYIETRVRQLPVYKCLVDKDWEEAQIGNVIVMRKHVNGNITAGIYLVDLLCLGIKDTTYYFNISEDLLMADINSNKEEPMEEISYNLAHNIVYAGHDFAMEFDIRPHIDFAITRFILEEDTDKIPVIEITVGDENGLPHLVAGASNRYFDALVKLKKNAGEGNYVYTVITGEELKDNEVDNEESELEEDDEDILLLAEVEVGALNCLNVQSVSTDDLLNPESIEKRSLLEKAIIQTELSIRLLPPELLESSPEQVNIWQKGCDEMLETLIRPNNVTPKQDDEYQKALLDIINLGAPPTSKEKAKIKKEEKQITAILNNNSSNPLLVSLIYENSILFYSDEITSISKSYAEKLYPEFPMVQLTLALGALITKVPDPRFDKIYKEPLIHDALPGYEHYYDTELILFWLIKIWISLEKDDLKGAINYYSLVAEVGINVSSMLVVLNKLNVVLLEYFKSSKMPKAAGGGNSDSSATGGKIIPFH